MWKTPIEASYSSSSNGTNPAHAMEGPIGQDTRRGD